MSKKVIKAEKAHDKITELLSQGNEKEKSRSAKDIRKSLYGKES